MENTMNQGYPINNPFGSSQRGNLSSMGTPIQYPYSNLIMNSPYDNYMGRNPQITHAAMFSYNVDLSIEQEELIADLISTYGEEIIYITNKIFTKLGNI